MIDRKDLPVVKSHEVNSPSLLAEMPRWPSLEIATAVILLAHHEHAVPAVLERLERGGPAFPVWAAGLGGYGLDELLPEWFPVAAERVIDNRGREGEHPALPGCVEGQLAVPAGQVQLLQAQLPAHRRATPIIESRVTSPASSASVMASVPGGRWGRTR